MKISSHLLLAALLFQTPVIGPCFATGTEATEFSPQTPTATSEDAKQPAVQREMRDVEGWNLAIDRRLLEAHLKETEQAVELLKIQLVEIKRVVPETAVIELQKVPLYFSPAYPRFGAHAEYHPNVQWLRDNGRDPAMEKSVEFTNILIFEEETRRMPNFALHELAHAYHDRVLGFEEPQVIAAYEAAKRSGKYDHVERRDAAGRVSRDKAYAMVDHKEYFAETSEAFFSKNDFFPFDRKELEETDPAMFEVLGKLWNKGSK
jgi:hypothetical protein